jgi:hypothetical protein
MNKLSENDKQILKGFITELTEWNYIMYGSVCDFARVAASEHLVWFDELVKEV